MSDITLINMKQVVDSEGIIHLVPFQDLIKHRIGNCPCGCYRQKIENDFPEEAYPEEFEHFEDEEPYVIIHVSKDAREFIAAVSTSKSFDSSIMARRQYEKRLDGLAEELGWDWFTKKAYLTRMDCAFITRWNTN